MGSLLINPFSYLGPIVRTKRKAFGRLSATGKRKALKDVRSMFKLKEDQYETPASQLAGSFAFLGSVHFKILDYIPQVPMQKTLIKS